MKTTISIAIAAAIVAVSAPASAAPLRADKAIAAETGSLATPVVVGDTIILTHAESGIVALDVPTGMLLGHIPTGSGMSSTPVFDPTTGRVYAITNRGVLVGVKLIDP